MLPLEQFSAYLGRFIADYGLLAIFGVTFLKETGFPVPIPSDLIMLAAAVQSATGQFVLWQAFAAIWIAMVTGAWVQYMLARELGRPFLYRFGRYVGLTQNRLDRAASTVLRGGAMAVGISLATPGLRLAAIPASGMARLPYRSFFPGVMGGSAVFLAWHFAIVYAASTAISVTISLFNFPALEVTIALLLIGLAGWVVLRWRIAAHRHCPPDATMECFSDWTHASCPICLALAGIHYLRNFRHVTG